MKTDNMRESKHVEDRRGQSHSGGRGGGYRRSGMGGSGMMGNLLLQLLMSRGGGKWLLILGILFLLVNGGLGGFDNIFVNDSNYSTPATTSTNQPSSTSQSEEAKFLSKVLASTEDFWTQKFKEQGLTYNPPKLVLYSHSTPTNGCGIGSANAGPFYCPADRKVYIDLSFYRDLTTKYRASGDFAMAYVLAHEVGHHVQNELGTMDKYHQARRRLSEKEANKLNVRLELQADYYAGAWAKYVDGQGLLDVGDIEEAMAAAHAVGDDTLQEQAYGRTVPDSFTHGTSEQRRYWFDRGYQYGDFEHGNTFEQGAY
ncbi:MAG: neutral zinc metallopeptidase [Aerococcaceae bacterium]|nr:neutral zinc metallopeptidase [Aerococcaceae bacterium]